jgi:hypothetical protein
MNNRPNLFSMVTKKSFTIGANIINHGPYTHQRIAGNNTQKGTNLGGVMVNQELHTQPARGMKNTIQTEPHSNSRAEHSEFKAMDDTHTPLQTNRVKDRRWRYSNKCRRNP